LGDENETRIGTAKLKVIDSCFGLDVREKLARVLVIDFDDLLIHG